MTIEADSLEQAQVNASRLVDAGRGSYELDSLCEDIKAEAREAAPENIDPYRAEVAINRETIEELEAEDEYAS